MKYEKVVAEWHNLFDNMDNSRIRTKDEAVKIAKKRLYLARQLYKHDDGLTERLGYGNIVVDRLAQPNVKRPLGDLIRMDKEDVNNSKIQLHQLSDINQKYVYYYDDVSLYGTNTKRAINPWQREA